MRGTGRPYCSHVRGETSTLFQAHAEAIEIGERAGVPVQHSHLKAAGRANHGRASELLNLLERAHARGVDVTGDAYPYDAGSTRMAALLPPWSQEGGRELLLERLTIPAERDRIKRDFEHGIPGWENLAGAGGWDKVRVSSVDSNTSYLGKSIQQIADERGTDAVDALCDLLVEERGSPTIVVTMMD